MKGEKGESFKGEKGVKGEKGESYKGEKGNIYKGEKIGIIGSNGSGKTTLLKIASGITTQTSGKIKSNGRVVSLIELGAGFHPELTGKDNVFLNGFTSDYIKMKKDKVINAREMESFYRNNNP